jgi:hypothetical protein
MFKHLGFSFAILAVGSVSALASPVKVTFSGQVSAIRDDLGLGSSIPGLGIGSPMSVTYVLDPLTADSDSLGDEGNFFGVTLSELRMNGHVVLSTPSTMGSQIYTWKNNPWGNPDEFYVLTQDFYDGRQVNVDIEGDAGFLSTADALPAFDASLLSGNKWAGLEYYVPSSAGFTIIDGTIDSVQVAAVPEPATFAALGLGVAALMRRRRK